MAIKFEKYQRSNVRLTIAFRVDHNARNGHTKTRDMIHTFCIIPYVLHVKINSIICWIKQKFRFDLSQTVHVCNLTHSPSRKILRKVTPDLHLTYSKNGWMDKLGFYSLQQYFSHFETMEG